MTKWAVAAAMLLLPQLMAAKVIKVLAIGNSFSDDAVEQYLYELAAEGGDSLVIGDAYRGGQGYESHWKVVEENKADFEYRKIVGGRKTNERRTLQQCLEDEPWDIITFQQVSQDAGDYSTYEPWLTRLIGYVREHATNPNVVFGLHRTWTYTADSNHWGFAKYDKDQDKMFKAIMDATNRARKDSSSSLQARPSRTGAPATSVTASTATATTCPTSWDAIPQPSPGQRSSPDSQPWASSMLLWASTSGRWRWRSRPHTLPWRNPTR